MLWKTIGSVLPAAIMSGRCCGKGLCHMPKACSFIILGDCRSCKHLPVATRVEAASELKELVTFLFSILENRGFDNTNPAGRAIGPRPKARATPLCCGCCDEDW
jgi:hypothetical protein